MLCRIRGDVAKTIRETLAAVDSRHQMENRPFLISGWYFASTGKTTVAFVSAVFQKLRDHANPKNADVEWLPSAVKRDQIQHLVAQCLYITSGLLVILIVWMLVTMR
jgi:uncharacterized membrane protein